MNKAVFLDRDGVINLERGAYTFREEDFVILPDVKVALKALKSRGYLLIIITNQGGIAKGLYNHDTFNRLTRKMLEELNSEEQLITDVFYCPHHPDYSKCLCRKPESLLLERAAARYKIDLNTSWMIGDKDRDCEAAARIGVKSIKIEANSPLFPILEKIC